MKQLNKKKIIISSIIALIVIILIIILLINAKMSIKTHLFDLTENEPLKQAYAKNQSHFVNDIVPSSKMTEEQYKDFLENPDNYIVYSFRCKVENDSKKNLKAIYEINKDNMWIDTITMANANDTINANSEINKSISVLVKVDGKSKEEIEKEIKDIIVKVHIYNADNDKKEIKSVNAKFE